LALCSCSFLPSLYTPHMSDKSKGFLGNEDNYADFLARLDTATASLIGRRESIGATIDIITRLNKHNKTGLELWAQRRSDVEKLLTQQCENQEFHDTRIELQTVALKMESMFRDRTQRLDAKILSSRGHYDEIKKSLFELEKSKVKLHSSRMLSQERAHLNNAPNPSEEIDEIPSIIPDSGLREDLREAREAVILAEALIEVKGN
jgi:hypothetical protein